MSLPWVSRALADAAYATEKERADVATLHMIEERQRAERAEARIVELTDLIVSMKRQGYVAPEPAIPPPSAIDPDPVDIAIRANVPPRLRSQVYGAVTLWRAQGMKEGEIVKRIESGEEPYAA